MTNPHLDLTNDPDPIIHCSGCGDPVVIGEAGAVQTRRGNWCERCLAEDAGAVPAAGSIVGVSCSCCSQPIAAGEFIVDNPVHKLGELVYIELLHYSCSVKAAA